MHAVSTKVFLKIEDKETYATFPERLKEILQPILHIPDLSIKEKFVEETEHAHGTRFFVINSKWCKYTLITTACVVSTVLFYRYKSRVRTSRKQTK